MEWWSTGVMRFGPNTPILHCSMTPTRYVWLVSCHDRFRQANPDPFLASGLVHHLGGPRPGKTLDDRPALFRCDRGGNYNHTDAQVQHGGFNLIAVLCLRHVAGVAPWHSTRCAHGKSGK